MPTPTDELTAALLRARDGDRGALAEFIRASQPEVWRFCANLVDVDAADDLVQETYLRAMRGVAAFRGDASARTWLLVIARRACADEIRLRQRRRRIHDDRAPLPDHAAHDDHAEAHALRALLDDLSPDRRAAFVLTQILRLPYAEAAEILEIPVGTIRSRVARTRDELAARLNDPVRPIRPLP